MSELRGELRRLVWLGERGAALEGPAELIDATRAVYPTPARKQFAPELTLRLAATTEGYLVTSGELRIEAASHEELIEGLEGALSLYALRRSAKVSLHAATVAQGGGALLVLGAHTAGKSTLSFALARRAGKLLGDDVAWVSGDPPLVEPLPRAIKLRPEAVRELLAEDAGALEGTLHRGSRAHRVAPAPAEGPLTVRAAVVVQYRPGAQPELSRLSELDAAGEFLAALLKDAAPARARLETLGALARSAPVFRYGYGLTPLEGAAGLLQALDRAGVGFSDSSRPPAIVGG